MEESMKKTKKVLLAISFIAVIGLIGCKAKADTINIGGIFPLVGAVATYGSEARNGILLAIDEINASGGVLGKQLALISEDDEGNPEKTVNAYNKLTAQDGVKIIIGSLTSGCTKAIAPKAQQDQVVLVAPAATATDITLVGNFIFRACFIDPFQGTVGGLFSANDLGAKRAAILFDSGSDYSVGLKDNFESAFKSAGGTIVAEESYSQDDVDFNAQITNIKTKDPDVIYLPDYYGKVAIIASQLRGKGITCQLVGGDGWDGIIDKAGDEVLGGFYSNHYASDSSDPKVQNFVKAYTDKYHKVPVSFAALGYDSMYLIRDAIVKANTAVDTVAIRDALAATDGQYLTGHLSFDADRNPVKPAVIEEIVKKDGKLASVYKTSIAK
jgi:branched-chain amino acid transport system substrate-binding protein